MDSPAFSSPGRLVSGDCRKNIHVWEPREDGASWQIDQRPFSSHSQSVEDLQWSPTEATVCAIIKTLRVTLTGLDASSLPPPLRWKEWRLWVDDEYTNALIRHALMTSRWAHLLCALQVFGCGKHKKQTKRRACRVKSLSGWRNAYCAPGTLQLCRNTRLQLKLKLSPSCLRFGSEQLANWGWLEPFAKKRKKKKKEQ